MLKLLKLSIKSFSFATDSEWLRCWKMPPVTLHLTQLRLWWRLETEWIIEEMMIEWRTMNTTLVMTEGTLGLEPGCCCSALTSSCIACSGGVLQIHAAVVSVFTSSLLSHHVITSDCKSDADCCKLSHRRRINVCKYLQASNWCSAPTAAFESFSLTLVHFLMLFVWFFTLVVCLLLWK